MGKLQWIVLKILYIEKTKAKLKALSDLKK